MDSVKEERPLAPREQTHVCHIGAGQRIWTLCCQIAPYAVLANLPFWIVNRVLVAPPRPIINLDYILVAVISLYVSTWVSAAMFAGVWTLDLIADTTHLYYFSQHDFVSSMRFAAQVSTKRALLFAFVVPLSGLVFGYVLARMANSSRAGTRAFRFRILLFTTVLIVAISLITSGSRYLKRDVYQINRFGNSVSVTCLRLALFGQRTDDATYRGIKVPSSTAGLLRKDSKFLSDPKYPNVVIVLVESYGLLAESSLKKELLLPFSAPSIAEKYRVQFGTVGFRGATVSGEFRELCGLELGLSSVTSVSSFSHDCLPSLARTAGYETLAIHGYSGYMFNRRVWWSQLGFESSLFLEDLRRDSNIRICDGPFPGVCDSDIAGLIGKRLLAAQGRRQLIYWVTLNSHLPLKTQALDSPFDCMTDGSRTGDAGICLWASLIFRVNRSIAGIATLPGLPPTEFLIVGDHAPPFLSLSRREHFSQTAVPYIDLVPREER